MPATCAGHPQCLIDLSQASLESNHFKFAGITDWQVTDEPGKASPTALLWPTPLPGPGHRRAMALGDKTFFSYAGATQLARS
jgi:hypothetical protein